MNELYISNCWIYFETNAKNYDEAMDDFLEKCSNVGIEINIKSAELRGENGGKL